MAMVEYQLPIVNISGQRNGQIHREDGHGHHIQTSPRFITRDPTPTQRLIREGFRNLTRFFWKDVLDRYDRVSWQIYANTHPVKNKKGEMIRLQPRASFLHINMVRYINGQQIIINPKDIP